MSQARFKPMTRSEFLAWEGDQELKWEFAGYRYPDAELYAGLALTVAPQVAAPDSASPEAD